MFQFLPALTAQAVKLSIVVVACVIGSLSTAVGSPAFAKGPSRTVPSTTEATVNLTDYGAVGDGVADDGPALQKALDGLADNGGGTLHVPAGKYRLATPVSKVFAQTAQIRIEGVPSFTPIVVAGNGKGLNLTSEFIIAVGETKDAITLKGSHSLLIKDVAFVGVPTVINDARRVLDLSDINQVTIEHCEFYGLASLVGEGAIIAVQRTNFILQQTAFLGCSTNSAANAPVVRIASWLGVLVRDCKFIDYGERANFFSKTPLQCPYAWILVGDVADPEPSHGRREVIMENLFLDEGGYFELAIRPDLFSLKHVPFDVYLSRINVNVNNLFSDGFYIFGARRVFIDRSRFGWSQRAGFAITLMNAHEAVLDLIETFVDATRLRANVGRLTVLNSNFSSIDSIGPVTNIITTDTPQEDPAQYVRQRYMTILNRDPDAAGHFYWTDKILRCEADSSCVGTARAALEAYLNTSPPAKFSVRGRVVDQTGAPLSGVTMRLQGSDSIAMETNANGEFGFHLLPTAGEYQITPSKTNYAFDSHAFATPSGDVVLNITGTRARFTISGVVTNKSGMPIPEAGVILSGDANGISIADAEGRYSFSELAAGGNYTVSVSRINYVFEVSTQSFANVVADQTSNFVGTPVQYTVSGTVRNPAGAPLSGAWVSISNGSVTHGQTTDQSGNYSFTVDGDADYVVDVSFGSLVFSSPTNTFVKLSSNVRADFSSIQGVSITVRVKTDDGATVSGVLLSVTGSEMKTLEIGSNGELPFAVAPEGTYEIRPSKPGYTFSPESIVIQDVMSHQLLEFTAVQTPVHPVLVSTNDPGRALALDAVLLTAEPFRLSYDSPWSQDLRTRLLLFVMDIDLSTPGSQADLSVELEDKFGQKYPLVVEHVGPLQQVENMNQIIVQLNENLTEMGDVFVRVTYKGLSSEPLRIGIGHVGP